MASERSYRFGPLERGGVLLGMRWPQLGLMVGLMVCVLGALRSPLLLAPVWVAVGAGLGLVAFVRVEDRNIDQWVPVLWGFTMQKATGNTVFRGGLFRAGKEDLNITKTALPGPLSALVILSVPVGNGRYVAVVKDARKQTFTAVLQVRGSQFALLEAGDQQARVDAWGELLAGLTTGGGKLSRIQWLERTLPDSGDQLQRHWRVRGHDDDSWAAEAYQQVIDSAGPVAQRHETYLSFQLRARDARRTIQRAGGGDHAACAVLLNELRTMESALARASINTVGWLPPRALAAVIRTTYDPYSIEMIDARGGAVADRAGGLSGLPSGIDPAMAGPIRTSAAWDHYRTDSGFHTTYWINGWPRVPSPAAFLAPLLMETTCRRTVSLVVEPLPGRKAEKAVNRRRMAHLGEQQMRDKIGKVTTQRDVAEASEVERREQELVAGFGAYRFHGFVTVSADDLDGLAEACGEAETLASRSRLEMVRLVGEQDQAFSVGALPLAVGVK
ncbi:MAG: SCO6880 family protein [Frankia sp.]